MDNTPPRRSVLLALETIGVLLSLLMVGIHFGWIAQESVPCPRGSLFACSSILKGDWSSFLGVPWSVLGTIYFGGHLVLTLVGPKEGMGTPAIGVRWLKTFGVLSGIVVVMGLRGIELVHLRKICPLCWGVALVTLCQAAASWRWCPILPGWNLAFRSLTVMVVGFAALGIVLTILLLQVDVRRVSLAQFSIPNGLSAVQSAPPERSTTSSIVSGQSSPGARPPAWLQPLGSPIPGPEVDLLVERGWTVTANPGLVQEALRLKRPVLLFAYDPMCEECHATMKEGLGREEWPTTSSVVRVAVEEASLPPEISNHVNKVPTLLLMGPGGTIVWRHEGRIEFSALMMSLSQAMAPKP